MVNSYESYGLTVSFPRKLISVFYRRVSSQCYLLLELIHLVHHLHIELETILIVACGMACHSHCRAMDQLVWLED